MKMKYNIVAALMVVFGMVSCNPARLEIEQKGVVSEDSYYRTDEDAFSAAVVIYSTWNGLNGDLMLMKTALADEVYSAGASRGDSPFLDDLNEFNFVSNNGYIIKVYSGLYKLVFYANTLMDKFSEGTSADIDRCIGEARMARAWAHMELASLWGNPPIIDHVLSGSSEYQQPNSNPEELWAFIIGDFQKASELLPSKLSGSGKVRMTKEAALSFKGKAEVLSGDLKSAKSTLKQVIDSHAFTLEPASRLEDIMTNACNYSSETVFESNIVYSKSTMWSHISGLGSMLNWRRDKLSGVPSYMSTFGFGYCNPREEYIADLQAHEAGSARSKAWFKDWEDLQGWGIGLTGTLYGCTGNFQYKFHYGPDEIPTDSFGIVFINNWRWMRYPEVLLLYAEACAVEGDSDGSGKAALNEVQSRAGAPVTALTLDNVKAEKKFELFMEGTRFVDLVRWGDAENVLKNQGAYIPLFKGVDNDGNYIVDKTTYTNQNYGFKPKHKVLPFPESEIISNQKLTQNPEW